MTFDPSSKFDPKAAIEFAQKFGGTNIMCFRDGKCLYPDGFADEDFIKFLEDNKEADIYFTPADLTDAFRGKPKKSDCKGSRFAWVDIDPPKGMTDLDELEIWRKQTLAEIEKIDIPQPQIIVFSGRGFWLYWRLSGFAKPASIEATNYGLADLFDGGDSCHSIDHLARLPYTRNSKTELYGYVLKFEDGYTSQDELPSLEPQVTENVDLLDLPDFYDVVPCPNENAFRELIEDLSCTDANKEGLLLSALDPATVNDSRDEPLDLDDRSSVMFSWVIKALIAGMEPRDVTSCIISPELHWISDHLLDPKKVPPSALHRVARRQIQRAHAYIAKNELQPAALSGVKLNPNVPYKSAKVFRAKEQPDMILYNDDWLTYTGTHYRAREDGFIRQQAYDFLDKAITVDAKGRRMPFCPNKTKVDQVIDGLKALTLREKGSFDPPCWLEENQLVPAEIISSETGLLHLPTGAIYPHTPTFFTRNSLDIAFDPDHPEPTEWLKFLDSLWHDDQEAIDTLQEMMGYLLIPDTSQQKIFLLLGPPRSGKGTIGRLLVQLVGNANSTSPSMKSLGDNFGLEPLIGKQLALVSDMQIGKQTDHASVVENLLRISGEDMVAVNRKFKQIWDGQLSVRFVLLSNTLPTFSDTSGALTNRYIPIVMTESFLGKEDLNLSTRLEAELPGILNWAIEGWKRLKQRGQFNVPESSKSLITGMMAIASPVTAFVEEHCILNPDKTVSKDQLFQAWKSWCEANNERVLSNAIFGRKLFEAFPNKITATKPFDQNKRVPSYAGIALDRTHPEQDGVSF